MRPLGDCDEARGREIGGCNRLIEMERQPTRVRNGWDDTENERSYLHQFISHFSLRCIQCSADEMTMGNLSISYRSTADDHLFQSRHIQCTTSDSSPLKDPYCRMITMIFATLSQSRMPPSPPNSIHPSLHHSSWARFFCFVTCPAHRLSDLNFPSAFSCIEIVMGCSRFSGHRIWLQRFLGAMTPSLTPLYLWGNA
jgi:hypothetical protein